MITPEMIKTGLDTGIVSIADSPHGDGAVCRIGEYWFSFGGQTAEEMSAAEYLADIPKEDIVREITDLLEEFRRDPGFADEYAYYEAFLNEKLTEKHPGYRFAEWENPYFETERGRRNGRDSTPKKTRRSPQR